MGNYKSKNPKVDNTTLDRMYPEPDYEIRTRPPTTEGKTWKQNIQLRIREEELADEAMPLARRKCYDNVMEYLACQQNEGMFWMVFNCQEDYYYMAECLEYEFAVEMDKRRRDMERNRERWWKELYDENGEVGLQKEMKFGDLGWIGSLKLYYLGEWAVKDQAYRYSNRPRKGNDEQTVNTEGSTKEPMLPSESTKEWKM